MNNKMIASKFDLLAKLMELHDENAFKIKSYAIAYNSLRKLEGDISKMQDLELSSIPGVGASIIDKIKEFISSGDIKALADLRNKTPKGIQDMLQIKGLGPKKVKLIWKEMQIDTVGELLYACQENRLVHYKGFGEKLQLEIQEKLEYFLSSQGKFLFAHVVDAADNFIAGLKSKHADHRFDLIGGIARKLPEVIGIELITTTNLDELKKDPSITLDEGKIFYESWPVHVKAIKPSDYEEILYNLSASEDFLKKYPYQLKTKIEETLLHYNLQNIPTECRESWVTPQTDINSIISVADIKGIIHNHSTYSDGLHSLTEMASYTRESGYQYFVISDHSKTASYAGGLSAESVLAQWREIDSLNSALGPDFKIFKGIESDILSDGSLDYDAELLSGFDLVIASVHSGLQMDVNKATSRLLKAIENPYTRILGHPTGRLLLTRPGYDLDFKKIIDACAENGVVIELNAIPQRLDIDYSWIPYCMEKNVKIAINPDAHSRESIHYIRHGVAAARKGGLTKESCLNTLSRQEFERWLSEK
jgi:DNA polymerase (family 10)